MMAILACFGVRPHLALAMVLTSQKVVVGAAAGERWSSCQLGVKNDTFYQVLEAVQDQTLKAGLRTASVVSLTVTAPNPVSIPPVMTLCYVEISRVGGAVVGGGSLKKTDLVLEEEGCNVVVAVPVVVVAVPVVAVVVVAAVVVAAAVDAASVVVGIFVAPFPAVVVAVLCCSAAVLLVAVAFAQFAAASLIDLDFSAYRLPPFSFAVSSAVPLAASAAPFVTCLAHRVLASRAFAAPVWHNYRSPAQISSSRLPSRHPCYHRLSSCDPHYPKRSFHCPRCPWGFEQTHLHILSYPRWTAARVFYYDHPQREYPNNSVSFSYHRPRSRNVVGHSRSRFGELRHSSELDANGRQTPTGICLLFYGNCSF